MKDKYRYISRIIQTHTHINQYNFNCLLNKCNLPIRIYFSLFHNYFHCFINKTENTVIKMLPRIKSFISSSELRNAIRPNERQS